MKHKFYYEVEANNHIEMGEKLGRLFGHIVKGNIEKERQKEDWSQKIIIAEGLLKYTEENFPQYIEELKAYAHVSDIPFIEVWTLSLEDEFDWMNLEKCTTVVTNNGKTIFHNEDWNKDSEDAICILKKTLAGFTTFQIYYYNAPLGGVAILVNSNGYIQAINSLSHVDKQIGIPKNIIARWLSETRDVLGDFEKLKKLPRSSGHNHVFVNKDGGVYDLECSATMQSLAQPSLPFVHTNHFVLDELKKFEEKNAGATTFLRYSTASSRVKDKMTIGEIISLSNDVTGGLTNEGTIAKIVINLELKIAKVWLRRENEIGWVDYPLDFISI